MKRHLLLNSSRTLLIGMLGLAPLTAANALDLLDRVRNERFSQTVQERQSPDQSIQDRSTQGQSMPGSDPMMTPAPGTDAYDAERMMSDEPPAAGMQGPMRSDEMNEEQRLRTDDRNLRTDEPNLNPGRRYERGAGAGTDYPPGRPDINREIERRLSPLGGGMDTP